MAPRDWYPPRSTTTSYGCLSLPHASARVKSLFIVALAVLTLTLLLLHTGRPRLSQWHSVHVPAPLGADNPGLDLKIRKHPIDDLILSARANFKRVKARRSHNVEDAAQKYRQRRGRHPPPGFDKWFAFAQNKSSVIVEEFFDRIYHDLNPFWAIEPRLLRFQAQAYDFVVSVRDGNATYKTDEKKRVPWIQLWHGLFEELQDHLPDVDVPVNMMDESRLVATWEEVDGYMRKSDAIRSFTDPEEVISTFTGLSAFDADKEAHKQYYYPEFHSGQYWELAKVGCHPNSSARVAPAWSPLEEPTFFPRGQPQGSTAGFVSNWTLAKQICDKPHLRGLHGSFIEPVSVSTSHQFIPLFGGSKLPVNNEILLPPATYLNADPMYSGGEAHGPRWNRKHENVLWRGVASGGRNKASQWHHFQRHRFVQMLNGTRVLQTEQTRLRSDTMSDKDTFDRLRGETYDLPSLDDYSLIAPRNGYLGDWLKAITDVAFVDLLCFPNTPDQHCPYTDPYFSTKDGMLMKDMYRSKYLPDIDGNSFSGRYRAFLLSTSLPIKATIYNEWHDDRLFPWVHFVPMDNTYIDIYGILDYFLGYEGYGGHDEMAQRIAEDGKKWAEKVLRREDMAVYTYRLMLEWARICDDNRLKMGWVGDIMDGWINE